MCMNQIDIELHVTSIAQSAAAFAVYTSPSNGLIFISSCFVFMPPFLLSLISHSC